MAVKFQYNKVAMQRLRKELKIRENALPTLKSKEAYLRVTIKRQKAVKSGLEAELKAKMDELSPAEALWAEFRAGLINFESAILKEDNVAGIKIPALDKMNIAISPYSSFMAPAWYAWGIETIRELSAKAVEILIMDRRIDLLEYARKKTTQKVNLYEKVQIPEFSEAILKIKRYLEDVENLDKAAQKITKSRQAAGSAV